MYFLLTGAACVLYYALIVWYTGKWNSTFAGFWMGAGVVHLAAAYFYPVFPEGLRTALIIAVVVFWIVFLWVELRICLAMKTKETEEVQYLIVLGAQVRGTKITNSLMRRIDRACRYLQDHPQTRAVLSGGQGKGEDITEAEAMAEELKRRGISPERLFMECRSTSTMENLKFSAEIIGDLTVPTAVVTNNFHVYRALLLGREAGYTNLHGIAASSNPVLLVNYMVREFFAVLLTKRKR
jgi:uncharacterized SAM-binding protein YcdF (DUF218 family)